MIVYYRLCDRKLSASAPSAFSADPYEIARVCLKSFVKAFETAKPRMVFICDYCPIKYDQMIADIVPFEKEIHHTSIGINETCLMQYDMFEQEDEKDVLFQEYDYLWLPDTGEEIVKGLEHMSYVTPYDHPDKYELKETSKTYPINGRYWKKTISTTATFATTKKIFTADKEILYKHGYIDHERWLELGDVLYSPIPSIATHLVADYLAPHVDWKGIWQSYQ
jgi:hypothetical protein